MELVAAVRRGDGDAFGELYGRYGERIVSYIARNVGDHARAEDIAQDVFISALRRMRVTERPIAFKPWIYEIARNACIDEFRRNRRSPEVPFQFDDDGDEGRLVSRHASPDDALESNQRLDALRGAFGGLSESHHKVLVMRELEGLSYTQIGERLGMSRPMVESTLFRARRRLGSEYEEIASGRRCEQVRTVVDLGTEHSLRSLRIRERRRVKRHLSHCQPCRRYARAAGFDESSLGGGVVGKIAALLPIPGFLRWRGLGRGNKLAASSTHSSRAAQSLQTAAQWTAPASSSFGLDRVVGAAAALAIAGGGVAGVMSIRGGKHAAARHGEANRAAALSTSSSSANPPQPLGIAAVVAGDPSFRLGSVVSHRQLTTRPAAARSGASTGSHVSHIFNHSSSGTSASQQTTFAPATPTSASSSSSSTTQSQQSTSGHSGSGLSKLVDGVGSTVPAVRNALAPPIESISQLGSSTLSQVGKVGSEVVDTVQGVVSHASGGS